MEMASPMGVNPKVIRKSERSAGDEPVAGELVEHGMPILAPYKMASREGRQERSIVPLGGRLGGAIGGRKIAIVAGPCSVESRSQTLEIAHAVAEAGAVALRGGAFKPRTNPYSFQGHGEEGLRLLAQAREETGLAIVTEVMSQEQVSMVAEFADVLQIGARNMQNFNLLSRVGSQPRPVLLRSEEHTSELQSQSNLVCR